MTRFELAASTSLTWRATSCATPRSLYLASVSQQTQALLYKSAVGKARGIFRYSANTQTNTQANAQTRSGLQRLLRPIMHLGFGFPAFTDAFRGSTCISELIFQHIKITFPSQMHPCQAFSANQDHFSQANASLNRLSCKSGSLFPCKCIPARIFPHIRITSHKQMHPCQTFSANQDHFSQANASLNRLFCKSGSLPPRKCIPARIFLQIRIISHLQMHPRQTFSANQDHFPLANASLPNLFSKSGSLFPRKCIPEQTFLHIRITSPSQMHPCQAFLANQDHFSQAKLCWNIDRKQSPALFHKLPVPSQIIHAVYASGR